MYNQGRQWLQEKQYTFVLHGYKIKLGSGGEGGNECV